MHGAIVTGIAAAVVLSAAYGLVVTEQRAGPVDTALERVTVATAVAGTYQARADSSIAGVCPVPPCEPRTAVDARFSGLPQVPYEAWLDGPDRIPLGPLVPDGTEWVLQWSEAEDHTDKDRIVLTAGGRDVAEVPVRPSDGPAPLDARFDASWGAQATQVYLAEIGGVTVSTIATAELADAAPEGWRLHAFFEGTAGRIDLGVLDAVPGGSVLDARVERVGIEDQDRLVIALAPDGTVLEGNGPAGFPVLEAHLG